MVSAFLSALRRAGGRIVTGPLAFLVSGLIDVCVGLALLVRARARERG